MTVGLHECGSFPDTVDERVVVEQGDGVIERVGDALFSSMHQLRPQLSLVGLPVDQVDDVIDHISLEILLRNVRYLAILWVIESQVAVYPHFSGVIETHSDHVRLHSHHTVPPCQALEPPKGSPEDGDAVDGSQRVHFAQSSDYALRNDMVAGGLRAGNLALYSS